MWPTNRVLVKAIACAVLFISGIIFLYNKELCRINKNRFLLNKDEIPINRTPDFILANSPPSNYESILFNHENVTLLEKANKCLKEIDVVYTWVNGSCPEFQKSKAKWLGLSDKGKGSVAASMSARFYDWDTMRYSIRSVETFLPCTRNLYIVTNGQVPIWLNLSNPKVNLITHRDIFPNKSHLPTFNSNAIEQHLHLIKGLSEKFLYFNDDILISKKLTLRDLYYGENGQHIYMSDLKISDCYPGCKIGKTGNGICNLACNNTFCNFDGKDCLANTANIRFETTKSKGGPWKTSLAFGNGVLSEKFGVTQRLYPEHVPQFLDKDVMAQYTKAFSRYINNTSSSKFRHGSNIPMALVYYNFIMSERDHMKDKCDKKCRFRYNIKPRKSEYFHMIGIGSNVAMVKRNLEQWYKSRRPLFVLIQDTNQGMTPDNHASHKVLREYFERVFPRPSQFESSI